MSSMYRQLDEAAFDAAHLDAEDPGTATLGELQMQPRTHAGVMPFPRKASRAQVTPTAFH